MSIDEIPQKLHRDHPIKFYGLLALLGFSLYLVSTGNYPTIALGSEVTAVEESVDRLRAQHIEKSATFTQQHTGHKLDLKTMHARINQIEKVNAVSAEHDKGVADKIQTLSNEITDLRQDVRDSKRDIINALNQARFKQ